MHPNISNCGKKKTTSIPNRNVAVKLQRTRALRELRCQAASVHPPAIFGVVMSQPSECGTWPGALNVAETKMKNIVNAARAAAPFFSLTLPMGFSSHEKKRWSGQILLFRSSSLLYHFVPLFLHPCGTCTDDPAWNDDINGRATTV